MAQCDTTDAVEPGHMMEALGACQKDAFWLAKLGRLLNGQGRYAEALEHLERALMLEPDLKDAQIDYAVALAGTGDLLSASGLMRNILAQPEVPEELRLVLLRQLDKWDGPAPVPNQWQSSGVFSLGMGYESNMLGTPSLTALTITFPGQPPQTLPLDESLRPKDAGYVRTDVQYQMSRTTPSGGSWSLGAGLRARGVPELAQADTLQYDLFAEHVSNEGALGYFAAVLASSSSSRNGTLYQMTGSSGGLTLPGAGSTGSVCHARVGLEWQERNYLSAPLFNGIYKGVALGWSCKQGAGNPQWRLSVKAGTDDPGDPLRAGGQQNQYALRFTGFTPMSVTSLAVPGGVLLDLEYTVNQDTSRYSPLLEDGRSRFTSRSTARLEYQRPAGNAAQWVIGAEWLEQKSSHSLFILQNWGPYVAFRQFF